MALLSTNGNNFVVHPAKNAWHCFRCESGGGPVSLIAILEGIIQCHEAVPGGLRGEKFNQTIKVAGEKYGLEIGTHLRQGTHQGYGHEKECFSRNNTSDVLTDEELVKLEEKIRSIPNDTPKTKIPIVIDPILREMATLNPAQMAAILGDSIKKHFGLTQRDITEYRKTVKEYQKSLKSNNTTWSPNQKELPRIIKSDIAITPVNPAQDYQDGVMNFAVKIHETSCLITSAKRLFAFEDAGDEGYQLLHEYGYVSFFI